MAVRGVFSDGFQTRVSPQTSASMAFQAHTATGKLKAVMMPIAPSGCHCSIMRWAGRWGSGWRGVGRRLGADLRRDMRRGGLCGFAAMEELSWRVILGCFRRDSRARYGYGGAEHTLELCAEGAAAADTVGADFSDGAA